jgi:hypothetical protein
MKQLESFLASIEVESNRAGQQAQVIELSQRLDPELALLSRLLIRLSSVHISKPKPVAGVLVLFTSLVLLASSTRRSNKTFIACAPARFRFANGRPSSESLFVVMDGREYVVRFTDYDEKITWLSAFRVQQDAGFAQMPTSGSIVRWIDVEVNRTVPALMSHDGCSFGNQILFFGGINASLTDVSAMILYDFETKTWTVSDTPVPHRYSHTVTLCEGCAYIVFGQQSKICYDDVWRYDFRKSEWSTIETTGTTPAKRAGHSCTAIGQLLYVFGGRDEQGHYLGDFYSLNTRNGIWQTIDTHRSPSPRAFHTAITVDTIMVVIGGCTDEAVVGDIHLFNTVKGHWAQTDAVISPRMRHRVALVGHMIVVVGGIGGYDCKVTLIPKSWTHTTECLELGNVPFGIAQFAMAPTKDGLLVFSGTDGVGRTPWRCAWLLNVANVLAEQAKMNLRTTKSGSYVSEVTPPLFDAIPPPAKSVGYQEKVTESCGKKIERHKKKRKKSGPLKKPVIQSSSQDSIALGTTFDLSSFLAQLEIDISNMAPFEQSATTIKAKRLYRAKVENRKLMDKVNCLEWVAAGEPGLPPGVKILLKLYEDRTARTRIMKVISDHSAAELETFVRRMLGRNIRLNLHTSPGTIEKLNDETLNQAHTSICVGEMSSLIIVAL